MFSCRTSVIRFDNRVLFQIIYFYLLYIYIYIYIAHFANANRAFRLRQKNVCISFDLPISISIFGEKIVQPKFYCMVAG